MSSANSIAAATLAGFMPACVGVARCQFAAGAEQLFADDIDVVGMTGATVSLASAAGVLQPAAGVISPARTEASRAPAARWAGFGLMPVRMERATVTPDTARGVE
ncbi:hypothetical protein [Amycolatopsis cihanbeyliensis]|uniref:hypothetical protein n=1 Tax=Amycolatopsis cihanbeyliensis TaxID=1128664 RepID=UPI001FE966AC|nr:hypothetical protein [Amycolatopsis cihanbeyliensis]